MSNYLDYHNILYIDSNGKVGVNNNTPLATLSLASDQGSAGGHDMIRLDSPDPTILFNDNTNTGAMRIRWQAGSGTSEGLRFYRDGDDGSNPQLMIDLNGRIGVGTANPSSILELGGDSSPEITFNDSTAGHRGSIEFQDGTFNFWSNYTASGQVAGHATNNLTILRGGNVGIGTTTPGARLHVNESINGINAGLLISNYNTTAGTSQQTRLLFGLARNSGSLKSTAGEIRVGKEQDWIFDDTTLDSYMAFNVYENMVSNERLRITSRGNVGIGVEAPVTTLEVAGNVRINGGTDYGSQLVQWCDNSGHAGIAAYDLMINNGQNGNRTTTMFFSSTGNVGIGTTSPDYKLHVNGADAMTGNWSKSLKLTASHPVICFAGSNGVTHGFIGYDAASTTEGLSLSVAGTSDDRNTSTLGIKINNTGNVGIKTNDFSYTKSDNTPLGTGGNAGISNNVMFVNGSVQLLGQTDAFVCGRGTATHLKDEELAFGWGGGWYMTDGTYLRVRNNKYLYSGGGATFGSGATLGDWVSELSFSHSDGGYATNDYYILLLPYDTNSYAAGKIQGFRNGNTEGNRYIDTEFYANSTAYPETPIDTEGAMALRLGRMWGAGNLGGLYSVVYNGTKYSAIKVPSGTTFHHMVFKFQGRRNGTDSNFFTLRRMDQVSSITSVSQYKTLDTDIYTLGNEMYIKNGKLSVGEVLDPAGTARLNVYNGDTANAQALMMWETPGISGMGFRTHFDLSNEENAFSIYTKGYANDGDHVTFKVDGRVGIGTTTPATSLHIRKVDIPDNTDSMLLTLDGKFADSGIEQDDHVGITFRVENSGGGAASTNSITYSYNNRLHLQKDSGTLLIGTENNTWKYITTGANYGSSSAKVTIDASSNSGSIVNTANALMLTSPESTYITFASKNTNNENIRQGYIQGVEGQGMRIANDALHSITDDNALIDIKQQYIYMRSSNNTEPLATLLVDELYNHGGVVVNAPASKQTHLRFQNNGTLKWQMRCPFHDSTNPDSLRFYSWTKSDDVMTLKNNGFVGIGTPDPQAPLHVYDARTGNSEPNILVDGPANTERAIVFAEAGAQKWWMGIDNTGDMANSHFGLWNQAQSNFLIACKSDGRVGIGTTDPVSTLQVKRTVSDTSTEDILTLETYRGDITTAGGVSLRFLNRDSNNGTGSIARIKSMASNDDSTFGDTSETSSHLVFETGYQGTQSNKMTITGRGDVGIGTMNPSAKFEVVGDNGQLFSVVDDMSGVIFSVNDSSGIPSIEVEDDGTVTLAEFGGKVFIGTPTYTAALVNVGGTIDATAHTTNSDRALKHNIEPIVDAVDKVKQIGGYTFDMTTTGRNSTGVIAQEVEQVLPQVVFGEEGEKSVSYGNMVGLLIEAIKEQQQTIEAQQARIEALEQHIK